MDTQSAPPGPLGPPGPPGPPDASAPISEKGPRVGDPPRPVHRRSYAYGGRGLGVWHLILFVVITVIAVALLPMIAWERHKWTWPRFPRWWLLT